MNKAKYPIQIIPFEGQKVEIDISEYYEQHPDIQLPIARRMSNNDFSKIISDANGIIRFRFDDIEELFADEIGKGLETGLSMDLLSSSTPDDAFQFSVHYNKDENYGAWDGHPVDYSKYTERAKKDTNTSRIIYNASNILRIKSKEYYQQFDKKQIWEKYFKVDKEGLDDRIDDDGRIIKTESFTKGKYPLRAKMTVVHSPVDLNYWHVMVRILSSEHLKGEFMKNIKNSKSKFTEKGALYEILKLSLLTDFEVGSTKLSAFSEQDSYDSNYSAPDIQESKETRDNTCNIEAEIVQ